MFIGAPPFDDLHPHSAPGNQVAHPIHQRPGIPSIGEDTPQPAKARSQNTQDLPRSFSVLDRRRMDDDMEDETKRINQEVSFASQYLFSRIEAAHSSVISCLDTLRVEDRSRRGFFFPLWSRT